MLCTLEYLVRHTVSSVPTRYLARVDQEGQPREQFRMPDARRWQNIDGLTGGAAYTLA